MIEQPYSYKPQPRFFGTGPAFLGLELEVEAPTREAKQTGLEQAGSPRWAYAKRDSSLGANGWEMVTHPICISSWMSRTAVRDYHTLTPGQVLTGRYKGETYTATVREGGRVEWDGTVYGSISAAGRAIRGGKATNGYQLFGLCGSGTQRANPCAEFFALAKKLADLNYQSHDGGRCGFHVHVSRTAFSADGTLNNPMFFTFKVLVNSSLFRRLSQRDTFTYCQQEPVDVHNYTRTSTRYSAVNITAQTVEVRIFRGNLREARLRKNIEAVIAAIEFAKEATDFTPPTDQNFTDWVAARTDRFPNLNSYIDHRSNR